MNKALKHLRQVDIELAMAIDRVGAYRVEKPSFDSAYEALTRSVVYQQLSGKAALTIYTRFVTAFGDGEQPDAPRVAEAELEALRNVGLSRQKATYLSGLAIAQCEQRIPSVAQLNALNDDQIIETLTEHKGIGPWTVQMLLMFWMGRPDILPADDLGIRKGFQKVYGHSEMPSPKALLEHGERWRPWRSVASWYLWRILEVDNT